MIRRLRDQPQEEGVDGAASILHNFGLLWGPVGHVIVSRHDTGARAKLLLGHRSEPEVGADPLRNKITTIASNRSTASALIWSALFEFTRVRANHMSSSASGRIFHVSVLRGRRERPEAARGVIDAGRIVARVIA